MSKSPCGRAPGSCAARAGSGRAVYDRRRRRWRHLDLGRAGCGWSMRSAGWTAPIVGSAPRRLPWARPGARHTRDFEDMVVWLAQRTDRTSVATLMRCGWETVTAIINRGVAELLDTRRLEHCLPHRGRRDLLPPPAPLSDHRRRSRHRHRGRYPTRTQRAIIGQFLCPPT